MKWIFFFSLEDLISFGGGDFIRRFDYCNCERCLIGKACFFGEGFKSVYVTVSFSILALCSELEYASVKVVLYFLCSYLFTGLSKFRYFYRETFALFGEVFNLTFI